jgi:hypothetical protein
MKGAMMDKVIVSDERPGDALREFKGERASLAPAVPPGESEYVFWFVTDPDNGFEKPVGPSFDLLKHLGDGRYGA